MLQQIAAIDEGHLVLLSRSGHHAFQTRPPSVRSLEEKDEVSIRNMVNRMVDARVEDGQLDEADVTLRNLSQIKEAFVQQLLGMYHSRIQYPDNVVPMEPQRRDLA